MKHVVLFFLPMLFFIGSLNAQTTGRTVRYVKEEGAGDEDGASWANAYDGEDLQDAIGGAPSGTDVYIAVGEYTLPNLGRDETIRIPAGVRVYGGFPSIGEPALEDRIKAPTDDAQRTIISGDIGKPIFDKERLAGSKGSSGRGVGGNELVRSDLGYEDNVRHVFTIEASDVRLEGVTIEGGFANGRADEEIGRGAGVYVPKAGTGEERRMGTIKDVDLRYLHAASGAAIFVEENFILEGLRIYKNVSYLPPNDNMSGTHAVVYASGEKVTIKNSRIYDNFSVNKRTNGLGGGVYIAEQALIVNCLIYDNKGSVGAGIHAAGPAKIVNCTVFGNESIRESSETARGGGIYLISDESPGTLANTISLNNSSSSEPKNAQDNILHDTPIKSARFIIQSIITGSEQKSDEQGRITHVDVRGTHLPDILDVLYGMGPADLFASMDRNTGNFLQTKPTSPAVNSGSNVYVTKEKIQQNVPKDIVGNIRIQGGQIDIGAFETNTTLSVKETGAFEPNPAPVRRVISIFGEGFSAFSRSYNRIKFLGDEESTKDDRSISRIGGFLELSAQEVGQRGTKIAIKVPLGAKTGRISVTINRGEPLTGDVLKIAYPDSAEESVPAPTAVSVENFTVAKVQPPCPDGSPPPCADPTTLIPKNIPNPKAGTLTHESITTSKEIELEAETEGIPGTEVAWCLVETDLELEPTGRQVYEVVKAVSKTLEDREVDIVQRGTISKAGPLTIENLKARTYYALYLIPVRVAEIKGVKSVFLAEKVAFLLFETPKKPTGPNCDGPNPDPGCPNPTLSVTAPSSGMRLYPNPSTVGVSPRVRCEGGCFVRVYQMSGRSVFAGHMADGQTLPSLKRGTYIVSLRQGARNHTQRIIVR